ncbi:hypothetical protein CFSAN002237_06440 [Escherichia coli O104:H21 str. CFSAN002237]|nr:hypothetical protein LY180_14675 [Escherichia coli LY180]ERF97229.1 hypothetical protein CFSAN002237_06440 [Escherichia coli O104:H21 str. CFSAN002237]ETD43369.1 hypothetical protein Q459_26220 [Escherichia coli ATCC BAA-2215]
MMSLLFYKDIILMLKRRIKAKQDFQYLSNQRILLLRWIG